MSDNPFATADPWEVSTGTMLPVGNHLVTIKSAEDGTSSGNNPQIELKFENDQGSIRDWLIYNAKQLGKVVALFDAAGIERPQEGEFDPQTFRVTTPCLYRLWDKQVGIVVREEEYQGKTSVRVKGYVTPERIKEEQADAPADTRDLPQAGAQANGASQGVQTKAPF